MSAGGDKLKTSLELLSAAAACSSAYLIFQAKLQNCKIAELLSAMQFSGVAHRSARCPIPVFSGSAA